MAYPDVIVLQGAKLNWIKRQKPSLWKEESAGKIGASQAYNQQALEKNLRNKSLQQREVCQKVGASIEIRLREELDEQEQVKAEIQQTKRSLQEQLKEQTQTDPQSSLLQLQLSRGNSKGKTEDSYMSTRSYWSHDKQHPWQMSMCWRDGGKAPFRMSRGAAGVKENVAYFMNWSGKLCSYNSTTKKWRKLPKCHYQYCSIAVVNGHLTAIGGCTNFCDTKSYTNKLLSLRETWVELFPVMPTRRRDTTAVTSKECLVVAGGMSGPFINASITTVEVMDLKTLVWSTVASLPHPCTGASATICGEQFFMLGGSNDKRETKSVLTCSLRELLQSSSSQSSSIWQRVADAPAYCSTCAAVDGELVVVGGCSEDDKPTATVHKYNPTTNSWDLIGDMKTARYNCLAAVLPTSEMMVAGGDIDWNSTLQNSEIASF